MKTRKCYSAQFKAELVLELLKEEKSLSKLTSGHGIYPNQLREWRKVVEGDLPQLFEREAKQQYVEFRTVEVLDSCYKIRANSLKSNRSIVQFVAHFRSLLLQCPQSFPHLEKNRSFTYPTEPNIAC